MTIMLLYRWITHWRLVEVSLYKARIPIGLVSGYFVSNARSKCTYPPSTKINWPVVCDDLSDMVNRQVSAISWVVVIRLSRGILFTMDFNFSSPFSKVLIQVSYEGVQLSAMIMAFERIPYFTRSTAHSRVRPRTPPLAAA